MASWFERIIDTERWTTAWNRVSELYVLPLTSNAFNGSATTQSHTDLDYDPKFFLKFDEYKMLQENWNDD